MSKKKEISPTTSHPHVHPGIGYLSVIESVVSVGFVPSLGASSVSALLFSQEPLRGTGSLYNVSNSVSVKETLEVHQRRVIFF